MPQQLHRAVAQLLHSALAADVRTRIGNGAEFRDAVAEVQRELGRDSGATTAAVPVVGTAPSPGGHSSMPLPGSGLVRPPRRRRSKPLLRLVAAAVVIVVVGALLVTNVFRAADLNSGGTGTSSSTSSSTTTTSTSVAPVTSSAGRSTPSTTTASSS